MRSHWWLLNRGVAWLEEWCLGLREKREKLQWEHVITKLFSGRIKRGGQSEWDKAESFGIIVLKLLFSLWFFKLWNKVHKGHYECYPIIVYIPSLTYEDGMMDGGGLVQCNWKFLSLKSITVFYLWNIPTLIIITALLVVILKGIFLNIHKGNILNIFYFPWICSSVQSLFQCSYLKKRDKKTITKRVSDYLELNY